MGQQNCFEVVLYLCQMRVWMVLWGAGGACLLEPYNDDPHNHGLIITPPDELKNYVKLLLIITIKFVRNDTIIQRFNDTIM